MHFYFCTDVPCDEFSKWQESLINKLGTDPAVKDLSRVMRLPGTLHLKDPTKPRFVKLYRGNEPQRWKLSELVTTLGLSPAAPATKKTNGVTNVVPFLNGKPAAAFAALGAVESLADGLRHENVPLDIAPLVADTGCGFIRNAMNTGGKDYTQPLWNLTTLVATFLEDGHALAHRMAISMRATTARPRTRCGSASCASGRNGGWGGRAATQFRLPAAPTAQRASTSVKSSHR